MKTMLCDHHCIKGSINRGSTESLIASHLNSEQSRLNAMPLEHGAAKAKPLSRDATSQYFARREREEIEKGGSRAERRWGTNKAGMQRLPF